MADIADQAQGRVDAFTQEALSKHPHIDTSTIDVTTPRFCRDCDEEIPLQRVKIVPLCTRCVECQELIERVMR